MRRLDRSQTQNYKHLLNPYLVNKRIIVIAVGLALSASSLAPALAEESLPSWIKLSVSQKETGKHFGDSAELDSATRTHSLDLMIFALRVKRIE